LSCILEYNLKIFDSEILNPEDLWFFSHFEPKKFYTLLSYYEDKHYYKTHHDDCTVSSLTWLYKEPKKFSGGELTFTDFGYTVECKCNNTILFPSQIRHSVSEVSIDPEHRGKGFGRYCISQFIHPISW
jgi:Rps23 Pro-64 3,4-dihydroxylase Tpa1-like proline 4-hydroxylase